MSGRKPIPETSVDSFVAQSLGKLREFILAADPPISDQLLEALEKDARSGARKLASEIRKRRLIDLKEKQRLDGLFRFENALAVQGYKLIAGVDEAGMAPLAGPVIAAAAILPDNYRLPGLDDSKKITDERKRDALASEIKKNAVCWSAGRAEVEEIDRMNIYRAGLLAMRRAVCGLNPKPDFALVDARNIPGCPCPQKGIIHGDALCASIAAASLIAKTTRDAYMIEQDRIYPGYGFAAHKGYPTLEHLRALKKLGPLAIHRKSFAPVREALGVQPVQNKLF